MRESRGHRANLLRLIGQRARRAVVVLALAHPPIVSAASEQTAIDAHLSALSSSQAACRIRAAEALGDIADPSATPYLIEALKDPDRRVRQEAANALGTIKDARAAGPLACLLSDPDNSTRVYAAYALGEIRDATTVPRLLAALNDAEWVVRDQAAWALAEIGDPGFLRDIASVLLDDEIDLAHWLWLVKRMGASQALSPLIDALSHSKKTVRLRAAKIIGGLEGPDASDALVKSLRDQDASVRLAGIEALRGRRDPGIKEGLRDLISTEKDSSVLSAAEEVLAECSPARDLMAHWRFEEESAERAKDATGRGNDGTLKGCVSVEGRIGRGIRLVPGQYVALGKPRAMPIADSPFTVMAWIRSEANDGVVAARGGAFCGFSLYVKDGFPKFGIHLAQDGPAYIASGTSSVVGTWVHLAGVVRGDRIELYANGTLAGTTLTPGFIPSECGQGMEIGFDDGNSPAEITDNFQGIIDEVKIFGSALEPEAIAEAFKEGDGR